MWGKIQDIWRNFTSWLNLSKMPNMHMLRYTQKYYCVMFTQVISLTKADMCEEIGIRKKCVYIYFFLEKWVKDTCYNNNIQPFKATNQPTLLISSLSSSAHLTHVHIYTNSHNVLTPLCWPCGIRNDERVIAWWKLLNAWNEERRLEWDGRIYTPMIA